MEMIKTEQYREAAAYLASRIEGNPETAIILGSGLGSFADQIIDPIVIPYVEIPHFMKSTATGHKGNFICGKLGDKQVLAMQGRFHYYEGDYPRTCDETLRNQEPFGLERRRRYQ